ncbi:MAG: 30S ribosomal protein S9 [Bacteroidales bacterium]|jgi:small subunit ribosomal protein S9|nr:30S ribosomal protein S9 [Bacteroidales bacterium]
MDKVINKLGRRKTAVARVYLKNGKGSINVNGKDYKEYFSTSIMQYVAKQALEVAGSTDKYDVYANITGGGIKGQAEALRLGIAKALVEDQKDDEQRVALKKELRKHGLMTRDNRMVERKKPGRPKARKRFQFSKR